MIKKILIGIDDSAYADHAAKYGFDLAETLNAGIGLVHMIEPVVITESATSADAILGSSMQPVSLPNAEIFDLQHQTAENILHHTAKKYGDKLDVALFNEFGSTGEGIIECSKTFNADLIIIGTHHRTGFDRLLNGSIAEYVVRHSHIPVLVIPSKE